MRDSLIAWLVRALLWLLGHLPLAAALALARAAFAFLDRLVPRYRRIAGRNLERALPELEPDGRERVIDGVFTSLARMLAMFARFPQLNRTNIHQYIGYEGFEHFQEALQQGRGVLFYTAHLGAWELSAFAHALLAEPMHVMVRPLDNAALDRLATRYRTLSGNRLHDKKASARAMIQALRANQAVGILADQNAMPNEGAFVPFFQHLACAHTGVARIAAHTGAAVIPGFALWSDKEQRYVLRFYPPVPMSGDAVEDTRRLHAVLESVIREYPDQWLWIHRRWKTRPVGDPSFY